MQRCSITAAAALTLFVFAGAGIAQEQPSIEGLLKDGWEIAGYASAFDGRTLILFKHKDRGYLTQCSVFYDVTRQKRVVVNCYEVR